MQQGTFNTSMHVQNRKGNPLADEWKRLPLGKAGVTLIDCDHRTPPAAESGYPYVAIPQMKEGRLELSGVRRISAEHLAEWTRKAKPQEFDVILSRRCNPGETAHVPKGLEFALGQNLVLLRADGTRVCPSFLRWLVRGKQWWEQVGKFINVGAIFESLRCRDIPGFELTIPPLSEQRRIAHILGTLDDKIELNRQMNATLEAMARALFQSWFVDFDPVRSRQEGRSPTGLDESTAALFPDQFKDSELGLIPFGWSVGSLEDLMAIEGGTQPPASEFISNPAPGYVRLVQIRDYQSDSHLTFVKDSSKLRKCRRDDVMIARYGASVARICWGLEGAYNVALVKAAPRKKCYREFLRSFLQSEFFQARLIGMSNRSAQSGFNKGDIASFRIPIPSDDLAVKYEDIAWKLRERILLNHDESRTLATLRDTLLPKLLSGELQPQPNAHLCQEQ